MLRKLGWKFGYGTTYFAACCPHIFASSLQTIVSHLPGGHLPPPKFGHLPPPNSDISHPQKKTFARRTTATPNFFSSFFGAFFLAFSTYSSWRTSRMGRRRCLTRWSWSTSSRGCVTRWSWSTSSRRCLTSWSWSTSSRGRRWKRSPRW